MSPSMVKGEKKIISSPMKESFGKYEIVEERTIEDESGNEGGSSVGHRS